MTETQAYFEQTYQHGRAPWDIGEPQPAVVALEEAGAFAGDVLDVGCGAGGNAIFLASRGNRVTGLDNAPSAIRIATERAASEGVQAEFAVADATTLAGYEGRFDVVLDSGLYHCLSAVDRPAYVAALARVARSGARLYLLSFTDDLPEGTPTRVSEQDLRGDIVAPWVIEDISRTRYKTSMTRDELLRSVEPADGTQSVAPSVFADLETDDTGRAYFAAWHLVARKS